MGLVGDFEAKLAAFQNARQAQLLKIGEVAESKRAQALSKMV